MDENGIKIKAVVTGLLLTAAGVLLYLFTAGILPPEYKPIVFSWQSLLLAIGFVQLFSRNHYFSGVILMLVGGFFLLKKMDIEGLVFFTQHLWAVLLVIVGILMICKAIFGRQFSCRRSDHSEKSNRKMENRKSWHDNTRNVHANEAGYIDRNYIFGGSNEKMNTKNFKGGEINCVFGGIELDLTDAQLAEGVNTLEINTVFGGVVLFAPIEWHIEIRQTQVFGNFVDNRPVPGFEVEENKTLIIKVSSVFGGGEIKCNNK